MAAAPAAHDDSPRVASEPTEACRALSDSDHVGGALYGEQLEDPSVWIHVHQRSGSRDGYQIAFVRDHSGALAADEPTPTGTCRLLFGLLEPIVQEIVTRGWLARRGFSSLEGNQVGLRGTYRTARLRTEVSGQR